MPTTTPHSVSRSPTSRADRSQAGFSLIELLIAMFILTEVMAAILLLFTGLTDIARAQTNVAEVQQVQRISHRSIVETVRESGLGGMPATVEGAQGNPGVWPDGLAIAVRNNVTGPGTIRPTDAGGSDEVLEGSDVLIVRGVFTTPVYYVSPQLETFDLDNPGASLLLGPATPFTLAGRQLTIPGRFLGVRQDFQPLIDAIDASAPRLLIVRDLLNPESYGLLEVTDIAVLPTACADGCITLNVTFTNAANAQAYSELVPPRDGSHPLSTGLAPPLDTVPFPKHIGSAGLLEEFRYYVRPDEDRTVLLADRTTTAPMPVLSRIETLPNTDTQIGARQDIARNVFDLQIAVGIDTSPKCTSAGCSAALLLERGRITEDRTQNDEVFFNHALDDRPESLPDFSTGLPDFHFVRLTTLVLAERIERGHAATPLGQIEDRVRDNDTVAFDGKSFNYVASLPSYRRRLLSTVIDLRNLQ